MTTKPAYIQPTSEEMFRKSGKELAELAAGKNGASKAAKAEIQRRAENKAAKRNAA